MNSINLNNLKAGVCFWRTEKPRWGQDLQNSFYQKLTDLNSQSFTNDWWETILNILREWVALRPKTKQFIRERGQARLSKLAIEYQRLIGKSKDKTPSIILFDWSDVEPLFSTSKEIKDVPSPVFASKLCHFLLPSVFPVVDNEVLGGCKSYQNYWELCQTLWLATDNQEELIKYLSDEISDGFTPNYPWPTKIFELCLIGERSKK